MADVGPSLQQHLQATGGGKKDKNKKNSIRGEGRAGVLLFQTLAPSANKKEDAPQTHSLSITPPQCLRHAPPVQKPSSQVSDINRLLVWRPAAEEKEEDEEKRVRRTSKKHPRKPAQRRTPKKQRKKTRAALHDDDSDEEGGYDDEEDDDEPPRKDDKEKKWAKREESKKH